MCDPPPFVAMNVQALHSGPRYIYYHVYTYLGKLREKNIFLQIYFLHYYLAHKEVKISFHKNLNSFSEFLLNSLFTHIT